MKNTMKNKVKKMMYTMLLAFVIATAGMAGNATDFQVSAADVNGTESAARDTAYGYADFDRGPASITINGNEGQPLVGKRFHIYQLFYAENAKGGESIQYTFHPKYQDSLKTVVGNRLGKAPSEVTEYMVIDYIQTLQNPLYRYFVEELRNQIVRDRAMPDVVHVTRTRSDNSIVICGLDYGYYIADEVTEVDGTHSAASLCMVSTASPSAIIHVKSDYPSVIKKIQEDDNPLTIGNEGWNDIADYEIGQTVPYKFESHVPDIRGYRNYYYAWHDKMDEALTLDLDSVSVEICGTQSSDFRTYTLREGEFSVVQTTGGAETFRVEISDIKAIIDREFEAQIAESDRKYGQKVVLRYDAVLNDRAAKDTGRPGFENDVRLEFSNDADQNREGSTGFTPWDTVVCFTYKLNVLKTNNHNLALEGAKFRLYADENLEQEVYVKKAEEGYIVVNRDSLAGSGHTGGEVPKDAVEMVSGMDGNFTIYGLDSGTYYLKETKAPTGYRPLLDPIVLTIRAVFPEDRNQYIKGEAEGGKTLQNLVVNAQVKTFLNGSYQEENIELQTSVQEGEANLTVVNTTGRRLPATGSRAVVILLGAGVLLMAGSVTYMHLKACDKRE